MNTSAKNLLAALALELYLDPEQFPSGVDIIKKPPKELDTREPVFTWYCNRAIDLVQDGKVSSDDIRAALSNADRLTGPNQEYVLDLLRVAANQTDDAKLQVDATEKHVRKLVNMNNSMVGDAKAGGSPDTVDKDLMRKAWRVADRAVKGIEEATIEIDPDLNAEALLAKGQAIYYLDQRRVRETIELYRHALSFKRKAGNDSHVEKLVGLFWEQIHSRVGQAMISLRIGGVGEALEILEACADAAEDLDNPEHAFEIRLKLAVAQRQVGQYEDAEDNFSILLKSATNPELVFSTKFELASVYSETGRAPEALLLQESLIKDPKGKSDPTLWSNYGNSLRLLNRLTEARSALLKAWELLPPEQKAKQGNLVPEEGVRIKMVTADLERRLGNYDAALELLKEADALDVTPLGIQGMHFYSVKANALLAANRIDEGLDCIDRADHLRRLLLAKGPALPTWESMFRNWAHLDADAVSLLVKAGQFRKALERSESTKGRVLAWLEHHVAPKAAEYALDLSRQEKAFDAAELWRQQDKRRRIVSLFATDDGLAVFDFPGEGAINAIWIDDVNYDVLRSTVFDPWEGLMERAMESQDPEEFLLAGAQTNYLLDMVGTLLWRAIPDLVDGGSELVIIPHRFLRGLPLLHARLPTGQRLSERFSSVVVMPCLTEFLRVGQSPQKATNNRTAIADADFSLPFARCEAILFGDEDHRFLGENATKKQLANAFGKESPLLISLHGDFNEIDPFRSRIFTARESFELYELMLDKIPVKVPSVILGVCEAGRSRRSLSDEPLSFPTLLQQSGVENVAAPSWRVDDFASFFYITRLMELLKQDARLDRAVIQAAHWLRDLTASQTLEQLDDLLNRLQAEGNDGTETRQAIMPQVEQQRAWLQYLKPTEKPFQSPLFWAAYQIFGSPLAKN